MPLGSVRKMPDAIGNPSKICVIGSINMDLVVRTPRFARPGETLSGHSWDAVPGGKGANQAVAAARLGAKTTFCGRIGNDDFGVTLRAGLLHEGIDVANLATTSECGSGVALITVDDVGRNAIYVVGGANHTIGPTLVHELRPCIKASQFLLLQLEIPLDATRCAIEIAHENGVPVLLDPAPAPEAGFPEAILQVDLLSPNEPETESLTGVPLSDLKQAKKAAIDLAKRGAKQVVIKLGERGALALDRDGNAWHIAPAPVKVVDTTAAGDAFSAALAVALSRGKDLVAATQFACAAGAIAVGGVGAQPSMPTLSQVKKLLGSHDFSASSL